MQNDLALRLDLALNIAGKDELTNLDLPFHNGLLADYQRSVGHNLTTEITVDTDRTLKVQFSLIVGSGPKNALISSLAMKRAPTIQL